MYAAAPYGVDDAGFEQYEILGVLDDVELDGSVVTDASVDFDDLNRPKVTMAMNSEGARIWARLTGANVGKPG